MHSCSAASADLSGAAIRPQRLSVPPGHGAARRLPRVVRQVPVRDPVRPPIQHLHHRFHPRERACSSSLCVFVCNLRSSAAQGGTCFKLGSRDLNHRPFPDWGSSPDRPGGGGYSGPEATQFRAPAGTVILYDARTWHRTGMNLTDKDRVAILNACIPGWIVPMGDQSDVYTQMVRACPMPLSPLPAGPASLSSSCCLVSVQRTSQPPAC